MKLILLVIFNIVCFNSISAKIIKPSDIFKGSNFNLKNKTKSFNYSKIGYNFKDEKEELKQREEVVKLIEEKTSINKRYRSKSKLQT